MPTGWLQPRLIVLAAGLVLLGGASFIHINRPVVAATETEAALEPAPAPAAVVDPIETTAIEAEEAAPDDPAKGSLAFREALSLIAQNEPAAAFASVAGLADDIERQTIVWAAIYYGGNRLQHADIMRNMEAAPDFVSDRMYRMRLEQSLLASEADGAAIIAAFGGEMPETIEARIALAAAYHDDGQTDRAAGIARATWIEEFLDEGQERRMLDRLGALLDGDDHWARAVHLMMHDRAQGVERIMDRLTPAQQSLAVARNAVSRNAGDAKALLDAVDPSLHDHPVYLFSRLQRARQFELWESAVEWANKAKGVLPDAAEWWYERRSLVRQLLAEGKPELAYAAAAGYEEGPEGRMVEAHFHAGFIALSFLGEAGSARAHFEAMRQQSTLPDSVTQANFWLGRALLTLGDIEGARAAFEIAAEHGTVYYGLLARAELGLTGAGLLDMPDTDAVADAFEQQPVVRAVRLLAANGEIRRAKSLLGTLAGRLETGGDFLLAARLAQSIGAHDLAIVIADDAESAGFPLHLVSFPRDGIPTERLAEIDKAAVYAVTRQESRFRSDAVSSAGALGLMQLMPATARETAAKVGVSYSKARLTSDPAYNALLGSTYLAAQLERYQGSLLLAAAAYNAGAGNANKWLGMFGDPRADNVDPVVWVELIPFTETRKYVQRVLGNYLVYRTQLGDAEVTMPDALRRIAQ